MPSERTFLRNPLPSIGITRLLQYYEVIRLPVPYLASSFHSWNTILFVREHRLSPVDWLITMCSMNGSQTPQCRAPLTIAVCTMLSSGKIRPLTFWSILVSRLNRFASLLPRCLRFASAVTDCYARLATAGWLSLRQTGVAPVRLTALRLGALFKYKTCQTANIINTDMITTGTVIVSYSLGETNSVTVPTNAPMHAERKTCVHPML